MKNILITGATSGIGFATAQLFLNEGNRVWITGRKNNTLEETRNKLHSDQLFPIVSDTSKLSDIKSLVKKFQEENIQFDTVFLNAGIATFNAIDSVTEEEFDDQFNTNVKGVFFMIQHLIPYVKDGASIIINASTNNTANGIGSSVYSATKSAVVKIAKIAANELAERQIRVNVVSPGPTLTQGLENAVPSEALGYLAEKTALQRLGMPDEIGKVVQFLSSDQSSFITGTEINVDGGLINYSTH